MTRGFWVVSLFPTICQMLSVDSRSVPSAHDRHCQALGNVCVWGESLTLGPLERGRASGRSSGARTTSPRHYLNHAAPPPASSWCCLNLGTGGSVCDLKGWGSGCHCSSGGLEPFKLPSSEANAPPPINQQPCLCCCIPLRWEAGLD